jgi:hypothetical protein
MSIKDFLPIFSHRRFQFEAKDLSELPVCQRKILGLCLAHVMLEGIARIPLPASATLSLCPSSCRLQPIADFFAVEGYWMSTFFGFT